MLETFAPRASLLSGSSYAGSCNFNPISFYIKDCFNLYPTLVLQNYFLMLSYFIFK